VEQQTERALQQEPPQGQWLAVVRTEVGPVWARPDAQAQASRGMPATSVMAAVSHTNPTWTVLKSQNILRTLYHIISYEPKASKATPGLLRATIQA
jgi:hypothetical protein